MLCYAMLTYTSTNTYTNTYTNTTPTPHQHTGIRQLVTGQLCGACKALGCEIYLSCYRSTYHAALPRLPSPPDLVVACNAGLRGSGATATTGGGGDAAGGGDGDGDAAGDIDTDTTATPPPPPTTTTTTTTTATTARISDSWLPTVRYLARSNIPAVVTAPTRSQMLAEFTLLQVVIVVVIVVVVVVVVVVLVVVCIYNMYYILYTCGVTATDTDTSY
jgi:hypothetical protein